MIEHLRQLAEGAADDLSRRSVVREYLQARVLEALQTKGVFTRWAFVGGTALRFLYNLPRFSEDLDFSLLGPDTKLGLEHAAEEVKRSLAFEGYPIEVRLDLRKTVAEANVRFPGLLLGLGLSRHPSQILSIKLEIDTNPPSGAVTTTSLVRRHVTLNLCHHDPSSLLAGKLAAVLNRPWTKGRDLFDLGWYLADRRWPEPNYELLNAAVVQTGWRGPALSAANWREQVQARLSTVDWAQAQNDVRRFLERPSDLQLVSAEALEGLLRPIR